MRLEGTRYFAAPREAVWHALTDPEELASVLPGMQRVEVHGDEWTALMAAPVGAAGRFKLSLKLTDIREPEHARLRGWGKSLGARLAIETEFDLAARDGGTDMRWNAEIGFAGLLGGLGMHALAPMGRQHAERVLDRLELRLTEG